MGMNWTKEQKQVIDSRNRNLLVSAAAGSGKTAVLVERIINMISDPENPMDVDRLLVMTFTKAAASEMRERIQAAIEKKLEENPEDAHLQRQAVMVQYAQITTIDSFCLHILRENFDRLEIDPAFRVGDEGELLLLKGDVLKDLLEDYYDSGKEEFENFVDTYASGKTDSGITDYISQVYTFAESNPWPEKWIAACRDELENGSVAALDQTEWMQFLLQDVRIQASEWTHQLKAAADVCQEEDGPEPYLPMILEDIAYIEKLQTVGSFESFCEAAGKIVFCKLAAVRGKNSPVSPEKKELVADCRKRIKGAVEKIKEQYLYASVESMVEDLQYSKSAVFMLLELAEAYMERYGQKKKEKNLVDFNDLEHFALNILMEDGKPSAAADEISSQYDEILVDEYQDSNLVQETLIQCISRERFGHPNVFMVGDVKQSIYKFRLARPELFLEKYHAYSSDESSYQKIELHQNFRSRDVVLASINSIFFRIMGEKLGGIEYTEETALHPGALFEKREMLEELYTEFLLLNTAGSVLEELDDDVSDYTGRELEAAAIAAKIKSMTDIDDGLTVWDKDYSCYRRAQFGDIVILLRSVSGWAESFTEVLARHGIPAFAESRTGYFNTPEVNTILNLLAVIDNPIQDIPLASVLKAPFAGLTDGELAHVTALHKRKTDRGRDRGIYGAVMSFVGTEQETEEDAAILKKLQGFLELLEKLSDLAIYLPLHELLYKIFDSTGYYDYVSAMPAGEVRKANLNMLVEKAAAYEATSYKGVFHFIRYIENLKRYNTDFGEASITGEQSSTVRIMSIHKSKGLEFPIVFVAGTGKMFNKQDARGKILIDADFGIGTDYLDTERRLKGPTLKKNAMKRRMELEALGEELRVLYVAMTRAKEKLILTASDRSLENRLVKWDNAAGADVRVPFTVLTLASSYLDWLLMGMSSGDGLIHKKLVEANTLLHGEIEEQLSKQESKARLLDFDTEQVYDSDYGQKLYESFHFVYPHAEEVRLNTKMSVSELKKAEPAGLDQENEERACLPDLIPTYPSFMKEEVQEERGVTRGTAYHRAMELLPFAKITSEKEVAHYMEQLCIDGKMTQEAKSLVSISDLWRFLKSDLGKRVIIADKANCLFREKQFVMGVPAKDTGDWNSEELVLIQGIIDAYIEEEDGLVLIDYKTDYVTEPETLVKRYKSQLDYYEKALRQIKKKPVKERYIYSYRLGSIMV